MDQITSIIKALGIDYTIGYQLIIFGVGYLVLTQVLFKPYFNAYQERVKRTSGSEDSAHRILSESEGLEHEFEKKARKMNSEFKGIFDQSRSEALHEYDKIVADARAKAKAMLEKTQMEIAAELDKCRTDIDREASGVSSSIVGKVLGQGAQA